MKPRQFGISQRGLGMSSDCDGTIAYNGALVRLIALYGSSSFIKFFEMRLGAVWALGLP